MRYRCQSSAHWAHTPLRSPDSRQCMRNHFPTGPLSDHGFAPAPHQTPASPVHSFAPERFSATAAYNGCRLHPEASPPPVLYRSDRSPVPVLQEYLHSPETAAVVPGYTPASGSAARDCSGIPPVPGLQRRFCARHPSRRCTAPDPQLLQSRDPLGSPLNNPPA